MASDVKTLVNNVHDLTLMKERVIKDVNYRKYLPGRHNFLRGMYLLWILLIIFAVILFLFRFVVDVGLTTEFVYYPMLTIFLYSLLMLMVSLVLLQTRYVLPIAATNEVKAKQIIKINQKLDSAKKKLKERLNFEIVKDFIRKGRFNPEDVPDSIEFFLRTNFPQLDYIKDIFNIEILKIIEINATNYMNEFSIDFKKELMSKVVNMQQLADSKNLNPGFVVGMVKWMLNKKIIFGMLTDNELEFVPEEYLSSFAAQPDVAAQVETAPDQDVMAPVVDDQETSQPAPAAPLVDDVPSTVSPAATPASTTITQDEVESQPTPGTVDDIGAVKARIDGVNKKIEHVKESYEQGNVGVDQYIHNIEIQEKELKFLKHKLELLERIQGPETHCMYCFLYISDPDNHVKCPNGHVFHVNCAHEYLQKFEVCPWCEEKMKKPEFI